ncbi:uncharacterized protein LODBEIA_P45980 [Lodderomyces beijingensis]|uniref:Ino eighty subunit 1 n=1 Tax=Lodderomyces beijingensis TaxID=1775926 RepID=A0ABP0ZQG5_9ASCO
MSYDPVHDRYTPSKTENRSGQLSISSLVSAAEIAATPALTTTITTTNNTNNTTTTNTATTKTHEPKLRTHRSPSGRSAHILHSINHLIDTPPPEVDDNDGDDDYDETDINSTVAGDDEDYVAPHASSKSSKKSKASGSKRKKKSNIANSKLSLKKSDGEPFWRKDIQHDLLQTIFDDETPCFTNTFPESSVVGANNASKITFAELYVRTLAESSKSSKILREKLLRDTDLGKAVSKVSVLVNVGRMNTTINFVHDMKSTLRTYHSIPSLQTGPSGGTINQLQDTPRLKSIIKAVCDEDPNKVESLQEMLDSPPQQKPNTNVAQLLFFLGNANSGIPFVQDTSFHLLDLFVNTKIDPKVRGLKFLWLAYTFLETDFSPEEMDKNPFGGRQIPADVIIPVDKTADFDKDTDYEVKYAEEMLKARKQYVSEDHSNDPPRSQEKIKNAQAAQERRNQSKKRERELEETWASDNDDGEEKTPKMQSSRKKMKKIVQPEYSPISKNVLSLAITSPADNNNLQQQLEEERENAEPSGLQFPVDGLKTLCEQFRAAEFVPNQPAESDSIAHKCDLVEISKPMVHEVRTSSKASTASFNKKITILGNWIYRYFQYKKSIGNKFAGMEWEDVRHDMVHGVEKYLYESFGKSLGIPRGSEAEEDTEAVSNADEVYFNYVTQGDFDKANEKKSFLLQLTTFANELFLQKLEEQKRDRSRVGKISFDLENETVTTL